jgi:hypothetical protein
MQNVENVSGKCYMCVTVHFVGSCINICKNHATSSFRYETTVHTVLRPCTIGTRCNGTTAGLGYLEVGWVIRAVNL